MVAVVAVVVVVVIAVVSDAVDDRPETVRCRRHQGVGAGYVRPEVGAAAEDGAGRRQKTAAHEILAAVPPRITQRR